MSVMEDRVYRDAKTSVAVIAVMPMFIRRNTVGAAVRADRFALPTDVLDMANAISFGREFLVNLDDVHGYPLLGRYKSTPVQESCQEKSTTVN
jgi:hypothetical protein